ncbi:SMC-Scp complex subunit ScpB [Thioalkalivibrio denitrificans]|uniref:SMC-Scp complex subunit ScpB n=1 Tax=Thioalkalivibrio denitrificans TaxID=108003 RepID=A0A1V3NM66_9GAMM|nr:SMC-Scp complex subunit ScpB [Thioalkalivibrio denitrificans]OOG25942.1 SMC-Scp complex subunit ScpB [Thioalkalivibrio denitrificans]
MDPDLLKRIIEGALLAANRPLSIDQLERLFDGDQHPERAAIRAALKALGEDCESRGYELKEVASGYRFQVRETVAPWVSRLWEEKPPRYTRALLETLALIAYRQPITRAEIEEIRGVAVSTHIVRTLSEREWIRVVGHRDVPGRPALFGTTRQFLDYFNLQSLDDLPTLAELRDLDKMHPELDFNGPDEGDSSAPEAAEEDSLPAAETDEAGEGEASDTVVELPRTPDGRTLQ